jgi:hypothetical protein
MSSDELTMEEIIAGHEMVYEIDGDYGTEQWVECSCNSSYWVDTDANEAAHHAHVAHELAALGFGNAAEAWDRAVRLAWDDPEPRDLLFNPYRCAGRDPAYQGLCQMPRGHEGGCFNDMETDG